MKTLGIALVGAGNIAQNIHLPIMASMSGVRIAAIADRRLSQARILAERYGGAVASTSYADVIERDDVDAVVVTTSTDAHTEIALASIRAGKPVFVERPVARTLAETIEINLAAREYDVGVMVGMNHRFRPDVVQMKNAVDRGDIGSIFYVKAGWNKQRSTDARWLAQAEKSGGGVVIDLGLVVIDLILHVFDFGKVRSVVGSTFNLHTKSVEDVVVAMVHFESGSIATIESAWSLMRPDDLFYCNVFGRSGSAYINPFRLVRKQGNDLNAIQQAVSGTSVSLYRKSYQVELKHFVNAVRGLVPFVSTVSEAIERMKIVEALYASSELSREVVVT